jgi:predicted RecB family nuclease
LPVQARVRDAHRSGKRFVSSGLARAIADIEAPVLYLDLEALTAAVPLYPATHPWQPIPFQWSLHARHADGTLTHREFLADGRKDPRREFILGLAEAVSCSEGRIVVWSDYEKNVMGRLRKFLPDLEEVISRLRDRLFDLHPVVKHHVYDVAFRGSFSIKAVAPGLVAGFGWHDLASTTGIADGVAAAAAFERIVTGENVAASEEEQLRAALRAYCQRDTEAMVRVHDVLRGLANDHTVTRRLEHML